MSTKVKKGANVSLKASDIEGNKLIVGVDFAFVCDNAHDLDASAFILGSERRIRSDADFIFYNQQSDGSSGFINLLEKVESSATDKHQFSIDLARIPNSVQCIAFCLTLHEAEQRNQNFSMADRVSLRLANQSTGKELVRFESSDDFATETALHLGELYRRDKEWKFRAVGQGYAGGLDSMARGFGVNLQIPRVDEIDDVEISMDSQVPKTLVNLESKVVPHAESAEDLPSLSKRKRRTLTDLLAAQAAEIRFRMKPILGQINSALQSSANESSSRLILDKILQEVLGYTISDIKPEQNIQGRSADYVLSPDGEDTLVIEAKRIGLALRDKQIYQATSYAAHSGITWALLTNVVVWRLYKITTAEKIVPTLVFTIDLQKGLTDDAAYYFALISKTGIVRKAQLDRLWLTRKALSTESLIIAILNDDVITRIRNVIARENGINLDLADVRAAVEQDILKLG